MTGGLGRRPSPGLRPTSPRCAGRGWYLLVFLTALACGDPNLNRVRPQLNPIGSPVDFGTMPVLNEVRVSIPVENLGRALMKVSNVGLDTADGVFRVDAAPDEVPGAEKRAIDVVFKPPREQEYTATLAFDTDDTDNLHVELELVGKGSTRAKMEVAPAAIDFGRVAECAAAVQALTITSTGTADLVLTEIAFSEGTAPGFSFVGSTRTPATVKAVGANGLPGQIQLTVKYTAAAGASGTATGGVRLRGTDPEQQELVIPLTATVNRAPVPAIAPLGNGAPGQTVTLDGAASSDPEGDLPLTYKWTLRSRPLSSTTAIAAPAAATTSMRLDPAVPGSYEVQLDVTDSTGAKNCQPARATVVATPAQKLLVEMFWDNAGTDLDLHVLRTATAALFTAPDDCFYQNRAPDWGVAGSATDDPQLTRDALTGYGPEIFGYVNPIDTTYRVLVVFSNELLNPTPASRATVRIYQYGVLKAELSKVLPRKDEVWSVADVTWPSGDITPLP